MSADLEPTLLQLLAENVPHRIYAKDAQGRFIFANQAVALGMGLRAPAELIGRTDFDFYAHAAASQYRAEELQVMRSGVPMLNHEEHVNYLLLGEEAWLMTTKIPLCRDDGTVIGIVGINYDITQRKQAEEALRVATLQAEATARQLADTVTRLNIEMRERQRVEVELRRRALHDELTGLPNRSLLMDRLEVSIRQAQRSGGQVTLLFLDLDRFKQVNDTFGHAVGDELLKAVTQRVGDCIRQGDTLARLGGDEFVLLLPNAIEPEALAQLGGRIAAAVAQPMHFGGQPVSVTCSLGRATFPQDGADAATLLQYADAEMYRAKQQGRRALRRLPGDAEPSPDDPREIEAQLRHALRRNEFRLQYQPQVDLRSGEIVGVEALIRWQHPEWGLVPPLRFIPIAEECGEIGRIGEWVLRTACAQAMAWQQAGLAPLRMGVNLSAQQFLDPGLEALVSQVLDETGLAPAQLELELTESVSMRNPEESIRILARFRAMGIGLAIDDFGTGYSNLAYLMRFPVDRLKLDRSFIGDLEEREACRAIVETVIGMAHRLQLQVVAEGIETDGQRALLQRFACDAMQGYWFSRPVDTAECERLLRRQAALLPA